MTTAIPTTPEQIQEFMADPAKMRGLFDANTGAAKPEFATLMKNYAENYSRKNEEITKQIEEQVHTVMSDLLGKQKTDRKRPDFTAIDRTKVTASRAPGMKANGIFTDSAEFFQAAWEGRNRLPNSAELNAKVAELEKVQNSFGTQVPADGGFLVPETVREDIMTNALETAVVRPRANVIPMSTASLLMPANDETTHAGSTRGGFVTYWQDESADLTESQAKFARVKLDASKLTAYCLVPNEMIQDAPAFMAWINRELPNAVAFEEDYQFLNGNGVAKPLGVLNADAMITTSAESGQTAGTIVFENLLEMYSRMFPSSLGRAVWVANLDTFRQLATMALSVGTGGSAIWLNNGVQGPPVTILGRPVIFTEKVPSLGTAGDISFIDFGHYAIGDRQTMRVESSTHYKFGNDQTAIRVIERLDGRPTLLSALTPAQSTVTQSAFVKLATR